MKRSSKLEKPDPVIEALKERPDFFDPDSTEFKEVKAEVDELAEFLQGKQDSPALTKHDLDLARAGVERIRRSLYDVRSTSLQAIRKQIREIRTDLNRREQQRHLEKLRTAQNPFLNESWKDQDLMRQEADLAMELLDAVARAKKPKGLSSREESQWQKIITQAKGLRAAQYGMDYKDFVQEARELAERSAGLQKIPDNYLDRFLGIRNRLDQRARTLGERVTNELYQRLKPELLDLAKKDLPPAELDEALDEILVSAF